MVTVALMTLAQFLAAEGISTAEFARLANLGSRQVAHKYVRGERIPRPEQMRAIVKATGGKVTPADFYAERAA